MSVLIKDMEIPKNCDNCWALDDYGDYPRCRITEEQRGYNFPIREKRMDKCPLVPIPPHGRLIDADTLTVKYGWLDNFDNTHTHIQFVYANEINYTPTIIEAEEGER